MPLYTVCLDPSTIAAAAVKSAREPVFPLETYGAATKRNESENRRQNSIPRVTVWRKNPPTALARKLVSEEAVAPAFFFLGVLGATEGVVKSEANPSVFIRDRSISARNRAPFPGSTFPRKRVLISVHAISTKLQELLTRLYFRGV